MTSSTARAVGLREYTDAGLTGDRSRAGGFGGAGLPIEKRGVEANWPGRGAWGGATWPSSTLAGGGLISFVGDAFRCFADTKRWGEGVFSRRQL